MANKRKRGLVSKHSRVHGKYFTKDGQEAPSVTTILNEHNKPAIHYWANKLGKEGIDLAQHLSFLGRIGTLAHQMIYNYFRDKRTDTGEYSAVEIKAAKNSLEKFFGWENHHEVKPILLEHAVVSEKFIYGGTLDFYGRIDGKLNVVDFKTADRIYPDNFYQTAAYYMGLVENGRKVQAMRVVQLGREKTGGFSEQVRSYPVLEFNAFLHCLSLYNLNRKLGEQAKEERKARRRKA